MAHYFRTIVGVDKINISLPGRFRQKLLNAKLFLAILVP